MEQPDQKKRGPGRPPKEVTEQLAAERRKKEGYARRSQKISLPAGYLARDVPGDFDGSTALPDEKQEKFAQLVASGATPTSAVKRAHPDGNKLRTPHQSGARLAAYEHVKRRVSFLRTEKARLMATEEGIFMGFVSAVETAMTSISDLVSLCGLEGLHREAASARAALASLAGRTFTHRKNLQNADSRGRLSASTAKRTLKELLDA